MKLLTGRHSRENPCFRREGCNIILDTRKRFSSARAGYSLLDDRLRFIDRQVQFVGDRPESCGVEGFIVEGRQQPPLLVVLEMIKRELMVIEPSDAEKSLRIEDLLSHHAGEA